MMCCVDAVKGAPSKDLKAWRDSPRLALLNLKYDAMPAGQLLVCVSVCAVRVAEVGLPAARQAGKQPHYLVMTGFDFWKLRVSVMCLLLLDCNTTSFGHACRRVLFCAAALVLLPEFVTMVVTEFGMIPPSSVPVILREFSQSAQLE